MNDISRTWPHVVSEPRDPLVVLSWRKMVLRADSDLVLFGYSGRAAQQKLGLFREHRR